MADNIANPVVKTIFQADITVVKEEILDTEDEHNSHSENANSQSNIRKSVDQPLISPKREVNEANNVSDIDVSVLHEEVDLGISVIDSKEDIKLTHLTDSMLLDHITEASDSGSSTNPTCNNSPPYYASPLLEVDRQLRKCKTKQIDSGAKSTKMQSAKERIIIDQHIEYRNNPRKSVSKDDLERALSTWMLNPVVMLTPLVITNSTNEFVCVKCNLKFKCNEVLIQHFSSCYRPLSLIEQTTAANGKSDKDLISHSRAKPFACNQCDYKFSTKSDLQRHSRTHTGEKPFACNECDYKFSQRSNLQIHSRTHTGEKPFACNECDYKCSRKNSLQIHSSTHTGAKPFACNYCDCKFSRRCSLQRHLRTHTREKPYACNICDKKFAVKYSLRKHLNTHR